MRWLYSITLFVSASLLFLVQPMVGKMLLPKLGGTPAVWNTCMVFFQALLLAGYTYSHLLTSRLPSRHQVVVHLIVLLLPLAVLPIGLATSSVPPVDANPVPWLFTTLLGCVGLPFFVVATSAPLLQKWFADACAPASRDPYFLYSASNLGSMIALLAYPTLVEPSLSLQASRWLSQSWLWSAAYVFLVALIAGCAGTVWRLAPVQGRPAAGAGGGRSDVEIPSLGRRLRWVALAFAPSSLMLGVTTHITLDVAAVPLLWVLPLALYLLSFILVFGHWPGRLHAIVVRGLPMMVLALAAARIGAVKPYVGWVIFIHLLGLFLAALVCHGELARSRPSPRYLTQFYLLISLGGVLGGVFNALVAPMLFATVAEYPIALVVVCLLMPSLRPKHESWKDGSQSKRWAAGFGLLADGALAALLGLSAYGLMAFFWLPAGAGSWLSEVRNHVNGALERLGPQPEHLQSLLAYGIPAFLCYLLVSRPIRFGLGVAAVLLAGAAGDNLHGPRVLHQERSFFGTHRVTVSGEAFSLMHGTTLHGTQVRTPEHRHEALIYFHASSPIGQVFAAFHGPQRKDQIGIIGLGAGSLACYAEPGQRLTYYEIDPAVVRIARNRDYFTFLDDCAAEWNVVLGDARLRLSEAPEGSYGLLVLDAFNSDAIPLHLLTREAIELYERKLARDGVLVVHISNRHLNLEPVLANLAQDLRLVALIQRDREIDPKVYPNKLESVWVVLARRLEDLGCLTKDPRWRPAEPNPLIGVWTDDYSNIWDVFRR